MKLTLNLDGKEKTYTWSRPKGKLIRDVMALKSSINLDDIQQDDLDKIVTFVADEVFCKQFTMEDVYNGLYYDELLVKMFDIIAIITNGTAEKATPKNA